MFFVVHDADGTIGLINSDYITSIDFKEDSTDIYTTDDMCYECTDPPSYFEFLCYPDFHHMLKDDFKKENNEEIFNSAAKARSLYTSHR